MPVIKYGGGKMIDTREAKPLFPELPAQVLGDNVFDNFAGMLHYRQEAISIHERIRAIERKLRPHHPVAHPGRMRVDDLKAEMRKVQFRFLIEEEAADYRWKALTPSQREEEVLDELFGVPSEQGSILGCWHRRIGSSEPPGFGLDRNLYYFISPEHAQAYNRAYAWHGGTDDVPETATRGRGKRAATQAR